MDSDLRPRQMWREDVIMTAEPASILNPSSLGRFMSDIIPWVVAELKEFVVSLLTTLLTTLLHVSLGLGAH